MLNRLILIIMVTLFCAQKSRAEGVPYFKGTVYQAMEEAQRLRKMLIVEFYASWNYKSRWMSENVVARKEVYNAIDRDYVIVKVDTQTKDGANLAVQYEVRDYPSFIVFNLNGNVVDKIETVLDRQDFVVRLEQVVLENDGSSGWELHKIYTAAEIADTASADRLAMDYIKKNRPQKMISPLYWDIFSNPSIVRYGSKTFDYMLENRAAFDSVFSKIVVEDLLTARLIDAVFPYSIGVIPYDSLSLERLCTVISDCNLPKRRIVDLMCELARNRAGRDVGKYIENVVELLGLVDNDLVPNYVTSLEIVAEYGNRDQKRAARHLIERYGRFNNSPSQLILIDALSKRLSE